MPESGPVSKQQILQALTTVETPDLKEDLVTLDAIKKVDVVDGQINIQIELSNPSQAVREQVRSAALSALSRVADQPAKVEVGCQVSSKPGAGGHQLIPQVKNAVAVASGKGGVGKSTVATNLATALHALGTRVGLMDADVYGPSIPKLMGATSKPEITRKNMIIPPEIRGIKLISMGYFLPKDEAVIWRGPMLHKMVQDFLGQVDWGELDYLVIDLPPGTGDIQLSLCQTVPLTGAAIVSTPQDLALEVASKAIAMFNKLKTPVLGIVENMSYYRCAHCGERDDIFGHGGAREAASRLGYPFLGDVPLSSVIRSRSDEGDPVALDGEDSEFGKAYLRIADAVATQIAIANHQDKPSLSIEM